MNAQKIIMLVFFITTMFLYSCVTTSEKNSVEKNDMEKQARSLFMTDSSLLSAKDRLLLRQLATVSYENCVIRNDRFVITISKKEWIKQGLPEIYYDILQKDIGDLNNYVDTVSCPKQLFFDSYLKNQKEYLARKKSQK